MRDKRRKPYLFTALLALVILWPSVAAAHIPHNSPYSKGVDELAWAQMGAAIFVAGQVAGLVYLAVVLFAFRGHPVVANIGLALLFQAIIAALLFIVSAIAYHAAAGFTPQMHFATNPYELVSVVRPEIVPKMFFASVTTFALFAGLGWLLLLTISPLRKRWTVPFVHTLVYHPLVFPVGIVIGAIHAIYVYRNPPQERAQEN